MAAPETAPVTLSQAINDALTNNSTPEEVKACRGAENCAAITAAELDAMEIASGLLTKRSDLLTKRSETDRAASDDLLRRIGAGTVKLAASATGRLRTMIDRTMIDPAGAGKSSPGGFSVARTPKMPIITARMGQRMERFERIIVETNPVAACRQLARAPVGTLSDGTPMYSIQAAGTLASGRAYETCPFPVRDGDTVESVAARFSGAGVTANDIREVNRLTGNEIPADRRSLSIPLPPATTEPK